MNCLLCDRPSAGELEFATGDDAEYTVEVPLCEVHLAEAEETGYAFEDKYAEKIYDLLIDQQAGAADAAHDAWKERGI